MYNLPYFKENDTDAVLDFIHHHPFAFIAGCDANNRPVATQLPVFIEDRDGHLFLSGHMMRNSDHHKALEQNPEVLCVFTGSHSYVSATWYTNPHQASTWNYMSVHVSGKLRFLDEAALADVLRKTTLHFEKNNPHSQTVFDNLPPDYRERLMKAIVAFEVDVAKMDNVFKLSQNHDEQTYDSIVCHLSQAGGEAKEVADRMSASRDDLFTR